MSSSFSSPVCTLPQALKGEKNCIFGNEGPFPQKSFGSGDIQKSCLAAAPRRILSPSLSLSSLLHTLSHLMMLHDRPRRHHHHQCEEEKFCRRVQTAQSWVRSSIRMDGRMGVKTDSQVREESFLSLEKNM